MANIPAPFTAPRSVAARFAVVFILVLLGHVLLLQWIAGDGLITHQRVRAPASKPRAAWRTRTLAQERSAAADASKAVHQAPTLASHQTPPHSERSAPIASPSVPSQVASGNTSSVPPVPPAPTRIAAPFEIQYEVALRTRGQLHSAQGQLQWHHDGRDYDARLEIGPRVQTSSGELRPEGLAPRRFSDKLRSEQAAHFDPALGRIVFSSNRPEAPLAPLAQDRLSLWLQLGALLAADPARYPAGSRIALQTVGTAEADVWTFTVEGAEALQIDGRELATVKLARAASRLYDPAVELWLAPTLDYLPVRIRSTLSNGDGVDQLASRVVQAR